MFTWVRQVQDDEEKDRDIQSKKVKLEAALFKRHQKEVASRVREMKAQEDVKRQEEYLNQAYRRVCRRKRKRLAGILSKMLS